jgi:molybdopterin-guanine dinucleotide biosynthesis protein A
MQTCSVYHRPMDSPSADLAAFILAGGKSTRMGADKAFITLDGRTLLARALELGRAVTSNVQIVGEVAKFRAFAPVIEDVFAGCGPLGGIHAALRVSRAQWNLVLAVDVPFMAPELLKFLIAEARPSEAIVTVPRVAGGFQPLCAVYRREFAVVAERALRAGRYKIDALFGANQTQVITEEDLQARGFSAEMFRNLNTPEELAQAGRTKLSYL